MLWRNEASISVLAPSWQWSWPGDTLGDRSLQLTQLRISHPLQESPTTCPPLPVPEAEAGKMWHGVCSAQGSKELLSGLPKPQPGMAGGPGELGAEGYPASSSGVMRRRELIHIQGPPRLISFSCSKSGSLNGAVLVTEGYLFSCSPPHGFPSPLPFSLSHNYLCPILTMQLVKTMTEIFPGQLNSNSHRSALSCGRFAVLFGYKQLIVINRVEDRNTESLSRRNMYS